MKIFQISDLAGNSTDDPTGGPVSDRLTRTRETLTLDGQPLVLETGYLEADPITDFNKIAIHIPKPDDFSLLELLFPVLRRKEGKCSIVGHFVGHAFSRDGHRIMNPRLDMPFRANFLLDLSQVHENNLIIRILQVRMDEVQELPPGSRIVTLDELRTLPVTEPVQSATFTGLQDNGHNDLMDV